MPSHTWLGRLALVSACLLLPGMAATTAAPRPHIFMVLVDDFGWAEVGYHRTGPTATDVHTPTIDSLVAQGIELNRHYVHMACTPTRTSFQSGRLPVHVTSYLGNPCQPNTGMPRNMTGIAEHLKAGGYATHFVGKWDVGMATPTHTPKGRGYDSSLNYFGHGNWMWTEDEWMGSYVNATTLPNCSAPECFKDFWNTDAPARNLTGLQYEEATLRDRVVTIIEDHDPSEPLFLMYASKVAHYPLQAPQEYQDRFAFIDEPHRRVYHAMVNYLDDNLANMTDLLKRKGMWDNTLMVLSSDNGGYVKAFDGDCDASTPHGYACFNGEAGANNYPLQGGKYSTLEGGIRVNAFVSGGFVPPAVRGTRQEGVIHVADWYRTFANLAGVNATDTKAAKYGLPPIDSLDVWPLLSGQTTASPRQTVLVSANALVAGDWKVLTGKVIEANWGGPQYPNSSTATDPIVNYNMECGQGCLFNVAEDPAERNNLASQNPEKLAELLQQLAVESKTIWDNPPGNADPMCNQLAQELYNGFLGPYLEVSP